MRGRRHPQRSPGRASCRSPVRDDGNAPDQHLHDALRGGERVIEGRARGDGLRIEQHQVRRRAPADDASRGVPAVEPETAGRGAGEVAHGLLPCEDPPLPHVVAEVAREGAAAAGVRSRSDQDAVAPARVLRVAHDRLDVLLIPDVHQDPGGPRVRDDRVEHHVHGTPPARLGDLGDRASDEVGERGIRRAGDLDLGPVGLLAVEPVAADLLELDAQGLSPVRIERGDGAQQVARRGEPAGQEGRQRRGARQVGIRVERDVDAVRDGLVDQRQELIGATAVRGEVHRGVREMHGASGAPTDVQRLPVGGERSPAVAAGVRSPVASALRHDAAQRLEFGRVGVHPGRVGQAARHPEGAGIERSTQQIRHLDELVRRGGAVLVTDDHHPQVALRHQHGGVRHGSRVDRCEQVLHGAPRHLRRHAVPSRDLRRDDGRSGIVERRIAETVLTEHLGGDALPDLGVVRGPAQHRQLTVRVHVDEARRQEQARRVGLDRAVGQLEVVPCSVRQHRDDPRSLHGDVADEPRRPCAVQDRGPAVHPHQPGRGLLRTQKHVATAPITRGSAASGSSRTATTRHLSKAVHGWDRPRRTTSPTPTVAPSASLRNAC